MIIRKETKQQSRNNPFRVRFYPQPSPWLWPLFLRGRIHPYRTSGITRGTASLPSPLYDIGNPKMRIKVRALLSSLWFPWFAPFNHSTSVRLQRREGGGRGRVCTDAATRLYSPCTQMEEMRVNCRRLKAT